MKGELFCSICLLCLRQRNYYEVHFKLLDLVLSNFSDCFINPAQCDIVQPDHHHLSFIIECIMLI
jgi:hypothetical protein